MTEVMELVGRPGDDLVSDSAGLFALHQAAATQSVARDSEAPTKAPEPRRMPASSRR